MKTREEILDFGFVTIDELENQLEGVVREDSFYIHPITFLKLDNDNAYVNDMKIIDNQSEAEELFNRYEFVEGNSDNSYNYTGGLARDIAFTEFKSDLTDEVLIAYRVHIGNDVRVGYTDSVWVLYGNEYDFTYHLTAQFNTVYVKLNEKFYLDVYVEGFSDYQTISLVDGESGAYEQLEWYLDLYDEEDLIQDLKHHFENDEEFDLEIDGFDVQSMYV